MIAVASWPSRPRPPRRRDLRRLRRHRSARAPIGQLILNQKVISGIGNVQAEALFVNRINPMRPGNKITPDDLRRCG